MRPTTSACSTSGSPSRPTPNFIHTFKVQCLTIFHFFQTFKTYSMVYYAIDSRQGASLGMKFILHTCPVCGTRYWSLEKMKQCQALSANSLPLFRQGQIFECGRYGVVQILSMRRVPNFPHDAHTWAYECVTTKGVNSKTKFFPEHTLQYKHRRN